MKFNVASKLLLQQLSAVSRIINSKNALSILDNFLLSVSNNVLTITGSDQENTITATVDVTEQEGEGRVAVNAKRLLDTLKELPGQPLEISVNDETFEVDIRFLNGHFVFMGVNGNEYPELGNYEGDAARFTIPAQIVQKGIDNTLFAASLETIRPTMTGVYWDICPLKEGAMEGQEDSKIPGIVFVTTDTHKLVRYTNTEANPGVSSSFIMPPKPAGILRNLISKDDADIEVEIYDKNATFRFATYTIACRFIIGRYPNYNRVIPRENPYKLNVDRVSLLTAARRVALFASQASFLVKMVIEQDSITLVAQDVDYSTAAEEKVSCVYEGEPMTIGFNANYLIDELNNIKCDEVKLTLSDPGRAGVFMPAEPKEGEDVVMLLMPMQVVDY